jgi:16S rRNA (guanine527-N7)-methyltransferase
MRGSPSWSPSGRKCAWLERAVETMGLKNVEVVHARAEEWTDGLGAIDLVTARAWRH